MRCDSVKQWGMGDETGAQMNDWQPTGFLRGLSSGWLCFLRRFPPSGHPGLTHVAGPRHHRLEFRDDSGRLRGGLVLVNGQLLMETDPLFRRRGICSALLDEAHRLGLMADIDVTRQVYTRAGWACMSRYLQPVAARERPNALAAALA